MVLRRRSFSLALSLLFALLVFACVIDEDLRINSDGSGTYRVKLTVPKELASGLSDVRDRANKDGYRMVTEGEDENGHYIVYEKQFASVSSLNDSHDHYELTINDRGFMQREYRLRCTVGSDAIVTFKRRMTITMPVSIQSASAGDLTGDHVVWDCSNGGSLDVVASGVYLPLKGDAKELAIAVIVILAGITLFAAARRRRAPAETLVCGTCHKELSAAARFCGACGAVTSA